MRSKPGFLLLIGLSGILLLLNFYQFRENDIYKVINRDLILENDSLVAVTIQLKRRIESKPTDSVSKKITLRY